MSTLLEKTDEELSNLLVLRDNDGRIGVMIGLLITVYFTEQLTRPVREAVADVADEYITMFGDKLRWALPPQVNQYFPFHSKRIQRPKAWLPSHPDGKAWSFDFHGGEAAGAASAFTIQGFGASAGGYPGLGFFHISLPLLWFAEHPGSLLSYTLKICERLHPLSGYAGIGVLEPTHLTYASMSQAAVRVFAERLPGLEIESRCWHINYLRDGIKGVNWLTIIGDHWLDELGGITCVDEHLPAGLTLTRYGGGAILQAGPKPEIGDVQANRWPQHYIAAAKLLKKVQVKNHCSFHFGGDGHMTKESSLAWLYRFDSR